MKCSKCRQEIEPKFVNGVSWHIIQIEYKNGDMCEIPVADELGEDCNAFNEKENIWQDQDEANPIVKLRLFHSKDVEYKKS